MDKCLFEITAQFSGVPVCSIDDITVCEDPENCKHYNKIVKLTYNIYKDED